MKSFESRNIQEFFDYVKKYRLVDSKMGNIHATGGGAYKYQALFEKEFGPLGVKVKKHDEMESMVKGLTFITHHAKNPSFTCNNKDGKLEYHVP